MVTPDDEHISCTPERSLLASHVIASQSINNRYMFLTRRDVSQMRIQDASV